MIKLEELRNLKKGDAVYLVESNIKGEFIECENEDNISNSCLVNVFWPHNETISWKDRRELSLNKPVDININREVSTKKRGETQWTR